MFVHTFRIAFGLRRLVEGDGELDDDDEPSEESDESDPLELSELDEGRGRFFFSIWICLFSSSRRFSSISESVLSLAVPPLPPKRWNTLRVCVWVCKEENKWVNRFSVDFLVLP